MTGFYSNAKLLITAEYLVLNGALALAIPLKCGQWMHVKKFGFSGNEMVWNASDVSSTWFSAVLHIPSFEIVRSTDSDKVNFLVLSLKAARELNPQFLCHADSIEVANHCNFDIRQGLGSSSTFLSNLAWWANVNPFTLAQKITNGSGYDIACARAQTPILFRRTNALPEIENVFFFPAFSENLYFVYSGKKQNSSVEIDKFNSLKPVSSQVIHKVSELSLEILKCNTINDFMKLIYEHERIIARVLNTNTIKNAIFSDFEGEVKSLGAWGGDFFMAASAMPREYVYKFFSEKGYSSIFPFNQFILKN